MGNVLANIQVVQNEHQHLQQYLSEFREEIRGLRTRQEIQDRELSGRIARLEKATQTQLDNIPIQVAKLVTESVIKITSSQNMNEELLRQVSALLQTSLAWFVPTVNESRRETRSHRKRAGDGVKSAPPFVQVVQTL
ncbi:hypothetical protein MAA_11753 [Metarhizium robertsii ARSEF 23]|uniref:Uncharacterized protein n=1 Tax=Metarhizium robertsii (strain ARSEF 23 / ATCC MYA-3075) TaxID=655844 RepID=A0A0B2XGK2_METRA|nr:uncharacterized protein MAA_11753 [Metarhizium robertsii ARSEF 23]KHO10652.1 hypothetical protein MAA_11753 [Metarhizium robertsii ARSEF 23]